MSRENAKSRLLESAVAVFSEKGYAATIAEIANAAEANIAAVNYHYGSKDELFRQVLRRAFEQADSKFPILAPSGATPAQRLEAFMRGFLERSLDPGPAGHFNRIMSKSINSDDTPHELIFEEVQQLELKHLDQILRDLLETNDDELLRFATVNVISSSVILSMNPRMRMHLFPDPPSPETLEAFIQRQTKGTLAFLSSLQTT